MRRHSLNDSNWRSFVSLGLATLIVIVGVGLVFSSGMMHGPWGAAPGWGPWTAGPWMWGMMGFFWIFPLLGLIVMLVLFTFMRGVHTHGDQAKLPARVTSDSVPQTAVAEREACRHCGKSVDADWVVCPYCGSTLARQTRLPATPPSSGKVGDRAR